jgi:hypothetical protein
MAALLLSGTAGADKPHRPPPPFSMPYQPAYRPDDQPEFPLTSETDETRIAPDIWDTPPDLIGETRVGVFADDGVNPGFLFIGANESRIGEDYLVLRCVAGSEYEFRLVLGQPLLLTQAYRLEGAWAGRTRTLKPEPADPETADAVLLAEADAAALFGTLLQGQTLKLTMRPLSGSGALLLALTFNGTGAAQGWDRIKRCQP